VAVRDASGRPIPGATVTGSWSGLVAGSSAVVSNASGTAISISESSKKTGTFKYQVTGISAVGYAYDPTGDAVSGNAITR
jgi:subtilisin